MPSFLDAFDAVIKELKNSKPEIVRGFPVSNAAVITDKEYKTQGSFLYVESIPAGSTLKIRFNELASKLFTLQAGQAIKAPFHRLFISTTGVSATNTELTIGRGNAFEFVDTGDVTITGAGLSTEATLAAILAKIIAAPATAAKQDLQPLAAQLPAALAAGGGLKVEGVAGGVAQPISAAALPLPAGAAIEDGGHLDKIQAASEADYIVFLGTARQVSRVAFDVNAVTTTVIAAVAAQKIYVVGIEFSVDTDATTFKLTENTIGDLHAAQTFMKGGGKVVGDRKTILYATTTVNKALDITTAAGKATGSIWYCQF